MDNAPAATAPEPKEYVSYFYDSRQLRRRLNVEDWGKMIKRLNFKQPNPRKWGLVPKDPTEPVNPKAAELVPARMAKKVSFAKQTMDLLYLNAKRQVEKPI